MSEKNTLNQQDTTKQNEKYDVVYNKIQDTARAKLRN